MENKRYHQHPLLFSFEPGDGTSYWVLFGQQQETWGAYTIFGFGEHNSPFIVFPLQGISHISFATFTRLLRFDISSSLYLGDVEYIEQAAWAVFCVLVGQQADLGEIVAQWRPDWRAQLPQTLAATK